MVFPGTFAQTHTHTLQYDDYIQPKCLAFMWKIYFYLKFIYLLHKAVLNNTLHADAQRRKTNERPSYRERTYFRSYSWLAFWLFFLFDDVPIHKTYTRSLILVNYTVLEHLSIYKQYYTYVCIENIIMLNYVFRGNSF